MTWTYFEIFRTYSAHIHTVQALRFSPAEKVFLEQQFIAFSPRKVYDASQCAASTGGLLSEQRTDGQTDRYCSVHFVLIVSKLATAKWILQASSKFCAKLRT
jgi:hypothetical protein